MLNILGVVFTSKNKNVKSIAFLLGFCSSSKGVSSLNFSLLHFPTLSLHPTHWLMFFPFPEIVSFSTLRPSRHAFQCCLLAFPSSFLCQVSQVLVQMSARSAHTWSSVRSNFINQKAAFCCPYSHPSFKKISLVLLPPSLFYFPMYFCLTKSLVIFFMLLFLAFKTSFFLPVLHLLPLNSFATRLSSMLLVPTTSTLQLNHLLDSIFTYFPYLFLGVLALSVPNHTDVKSIPCPLLLSNGTIFYWELTAHIGCNNQIFSQGHMMTCKC